MKILTAQEGNEYLSRIGMEIGNWNQIANSQLAGSTKDKWMSYQAPKKALELFCFSRYVAGWLPKGDWKIFQIDNSTVMGADEMSLFGRLLFGSKNVPNIYENRTFLFEFGTTDLKNQNNELLLANLIFVFLLFECHGYLVSSNSSEGELIGVQDGDIILSTRNQNLSDAENMLDEFNNNPLKSPEWINQ